MTLGPVPTTARIAMRSAHLILLCAVLSLWSGATTPLHSQVTIASDRPGIGSGSFVLGRGTLHLETGAEYGRSGDADVVSVGQVLLRLGLGRSLEIQGLANSLVLERGSGSDQEGLQDMGIGAKVGIVSEGAGGLSVSVLSTLSFPSGADAFSSGETIPGLTLLADLPLSQSVGLSTNLGYSAWLADAEDEVSVIVTSSLSIPGTDGLGAYGGYAGFYSDAGDRHYAEGGLTWISGADLQFDLNTGVDVESGDFFLGFGLATRWFLR